MIKLTGMECIIIKMELFIRENVILLKFIVRVKRLATWKRGR